MHRYPWQREPLTAHSTDRKCSSPPLQRTATERSRGRAATEQHSPSLREVLTGRSRSPSRSDAEADYRLTETPGKGKRLDPDIRLKKSKTTSAGCRNRHPSRGARRCRSRHRYDRILWRVPRSWPIKDSIWATLPRWALPWHRPQGR